MPKRLADRLREVRQSRFVGRDAEQIVFQSTVTAQDLPVSVLYIFGPGGVGKTTLLNRFVDLCDQAGIAVVRLDGREIDATPEQFMRALGSAMGLGPGESPVDVLSTAASRHVILIDTYEQLASLDRWLRETFLPQMSDEVLVVLAGRNPPSAGWRSDSAWQSLLHVLPLRNLSPEESRNYLEKRGVPGEQLADVLSFTHGHPLALSLIADVFDQNVDLAFDPEAKPDIIQLILDRLLENVPSAAHRKTLESCALVRAMTEPLLASMLEVPDPSSRTAAGQGSSATEMPVEAASNGSANDDSVRVLFKWLRQLSFVEVGRAGLYLHELARDTLAADLRWRNPDEYNELHDRARRFYARHITQSGGAQQSTMIDYIFLHRDNAVVRPFFEQIRTQAPGIANMLPDTPRQSDWSDLVAMVAQHEGSDAAELARAWFEQQPGKVIVWRDQKDQPSGFMAILALDKATHEDIERDPATRAAWRYMQAWAPLRPGETASYIRFWVTRDMYQTISPLQTLIFVSMALHYITTPGLAYSFLPCADPDFWAPLFAYADLARIREADFELGGHAYGIYGHDWRQTPPIAWLDLLAARETARMPQSIQRTMTSEPLAVLSRPEFTDAVLDLLRNYHRPDVLRKNPLVHSRLVVADDGNDADDASRIETLRARVRAACEMLRSSPRQAKFYRALDLTYLEPAPTQEIAAERLDVPFRTFRRHLKSGIDEITEILWRQEVGVE